MHVFSCIIADTLPRTWRTSRTKFSNSGQTVWFRPT